MVKKFVTIWVVTRGEGVKANSDKQWRGRRGIKNWDFYGDILFEWPLTGLFNDYVALNFSLFQPRTPIITHCNRPASTQSLSSLIDCYYVTVTLLNSIWLYYNTLHSIFYNFGICGMYWTFNKASAIRVIRLL